MMKMRSQYLPEESRSTIINFFRIPLNMFVCIMLYNVSPGLYPPACPLALLAFVPLAFGPLALRPMLLQDFLSTNLPAYKAFTRHDNNANVSFLVALVWSFRSICYLLLCWKALYFASELLGNVIVCALGF